MKAPHRIYDLFSIQSATQSVKDHVSIYIERAEQMRTDPDKKQRLALFLCIACNYGGARMAGQAFTEWTCARCDLEATHHNTAVPTLCDKCASITGLCVRCMADVNGRMRRKLP